MNLVYGQDARVARWVQAHGPHAGDFGQYVAVGVEEGNELIAGWVFSEYRGRDIHVSMASTTPRWASRRTLYAIFVYPFVQLKVARLTAYTGQSMTSVRRFLERLGFVHEGTMRQGYVDDDIAVYGMLRDECRWIPEVDHAERARTAARA